MTHLTSKMLELEQRPRLLLEGRLAFRNAWVVRNRPEKQPVHRRTIGWEIGYDEENNFAHMGARYIDDDNWGRMKPPKPRARKRSDFIKSAFIIATAKAMQSETA